MSDVFTSSFAENVYRMKYSLDGKETWRDTCTRVATHIMLSLGYGPNHELTKEIIELMYLRYIIPGGRYLRSTGRAVSQIKNCTGFRAEDTAEGWAKLLQKVALSLMHGLGCGVEYSSCREEGSPLKRKGGFSSGPISLMHMIDNITAHVMSGGDRRGANLAQLSWRHPDIFKFIAAKNWSQETLDALAKSWNAYAPLKFTNISVRVGDGFLAALDVGDNHALSVFDTVINQMVRNGEPGLICNFGDRKKEMITNACGEYRSDKDSSTCNLVAVNWARISDLATFKRCVEMASVLAVAGNKYTYYPTEKMAQVVEEDNDIGVGAMGLAEWFVKRGYKYGEESEELKAWLSVYASNIELVTPFCNKHHLPIPKRGRAIAPTGSISIISETSGGCEPIFCTSYKRKVLKGGTTLMSEYVIDPVAKRLIEQGASPESIEDAYNVPYERRLAFQALLQDHVDMAISSTLNLPRWGSEANNENTVEEFKRVVRRYLPRLRGITAFPDGSRGMAQPLTPVAYKTALKYAGQGLVEDSVQICDLRGGSCGA
jgi:ribonucleoside-diphosphate reductase alpha chain